MAEFVPLEHYVNTPAPPRDPEDCTAVLEPSVELRETLHEIRRFRAGLGDAFEAAREELLRDLAADVLARELTSAPVEIERIASRVLARFDDDEPLRILAHAGDVPALTGLGLPVVTDARLRRGDVQIMLRHGTIDASLGVRLAHVLEARR